MSLFRRRDFAYKIISKSRYFDKKWYLKTYPDVAESNLDPVRHYLVYGWKQGYNPSEKFDTNAYLTENPDVRQAAMNPLLHYEQFGHNEGRNVRGIKNQADGYNLNKWQQLLHCVTRFLARLLYCNTIKNNQNKKILVILHLFYMDSWKAIKLYLDNLSVYNYDLIVSCTKDYYDKSVLDKIKQIHPETKFYVYPNRGFDIGPFLDVLQKINLAKYDIVFKLHSKGIHRKFLYIYNQIFKNTDWFYNLYNGILGSFSVHKVISAFARDDKIGLVASKNLIVHDPKHKQSLTKQIADNYHLKLKANYSYVAGSCFVIKAKCLARITKLNLTIQDFAKTRRGLFSLAHAMERIVCATVEAQKLKLYGIPVPHNKYSKELKLAQQTSALRLLGDKRIILNDEFFYRALEGRKIANYSIKKIALKDIQRVWKGKTLSLSECHPYTYLNGNIKAYEKYCKENKKLFSIEMSVNRYDKLLASIKANGFQSKNMPVIDAKNNVIMDGQHRCCYLLKKFGPDYKVRALFVDMI